MNYGEPLMQNGIDFAKFVDKNRVSFNKIVLVHGAVVVVDYIINIMQLHQNCVEKILN